MTVPNVPAVPKMRYSEWITDQGLPPRPSGLCHVVAAQMVEAFPELRLVRGHFEPWEGTRKWPHWWCQTSDGTVVDPTAGQFAGLGPGDYVEHVGKEPTGRCYQCGLYVFHGEPFCDAICGDTWKATEGGTIAIGNPDAR
jgi:hypothetical protein